MSDFLWGVAIVLSAFGVLMITVGIFDGVPIIGSTGFATKVCESHGMVLVSHKGTAEIVCEKSITPEPNPTRKVFRFD